VGITRARARLALTHAESRALHGARDYRMPSRFLAEIPADATSVPAGARAPARITTATRPAGRAVRSDPLATGDSVLHATFGEGVVTAVERGGELVRVRFANDGAERRLMAGAAPMRKVGTG
jgi:DNA helicase-2/ATP-dependent DNA helicase PcrA